MEHPALKRADFTLYGNIAMYGRFGSISLIFVVAASLAACGRAFAGSPPLVIDDPETPGYRGWEINITSSYEQTREGFEMENPLFDINYGLTSDRDQLKVEFAVVDVDPSGEEAEWGISDLLVGYKYRFIDFDDTCSGWAVSFYPQVSSPTGDEDRGIGSGQTELSFPFQFQKNFEESKSWINPEIGYTVVLGDTDFNNWKMGVAVGKEFTEKLELEGEIGAFIFPNDAEPDFPFFNFGFEYRYSKNINLLGSAGRSFRSREDGVPDFFCLLGVQFLLGKAAEEEGPGGEQEGGGEGADDIKSPEAFSPSFLHEHTAHSTHHIERYLRNPAS
jgi:hypothetical protein